MEMQQSLVINPMCEEDFSWAVDSQRDSMIGLCASPSSDDSQSSFLNGAGKQTDDKKKASTYKHVPHREKPPHLVARRNARERRRVQAVNGVFAKLRKCVPIENRSKRLSKVKTLHKAIEYIAALRKLLAETDPKKQDRQVTSPGATAVHLGGDISNDDPNNNNNNNNNSGSCIDSAASSPTKAGYTQIGEVSSTSSFKQDLVPQSASWAPSADQFPAGQDYPYLSSYAGYVPSYQQETSYSCGPAYLYPTTSSGSGDLPC